MEEEEVGRLGSSQCFGERALLSSERRTASVYADENVTLLSLSKKFSKRLYPARQLVRYTAMMTILYLEITCCFTLKNTLMYWR